MTCLIEFLSSWVSFLLSSCQSIYLCSYYPSFNVSVFLCIPVLALMCSFLPVFLFFSIFLSFYLPMFLSFFFLLPCLPVFIVYIPLFVCFCVFVLLFSCFPIFCHPRKTRSICSIFFLSSYPNIIISSCLKDFIFTVIFSSFILVSLLSFILPFHFPFVFLCSMILFFFFSCVHVFQATKQAWYLSMPLREFH